MIVYYFRITYLKRMFIHNILIQEYSQRVYKDLLFEQGEEEEEDWWLEQLHWRDYNDDDDTQQNGPPMDVKKDPSRSLLMSIA